MFAILYTIFGVVLKLGAGTPNYPLSLLLGIVLFNFFAEATSGALKSVVAKGSLIRKIDIPRYLIPIASTASAFVNALLNLVVVFVFVLVLAPFNELSLKTLFLFPILIIELVIFTLGVGYFLSALYVRLRDINHIWEVVRQALFYSIPIIYPLSRVPYENIQQIMLSNPLVQIIQDARVVITYEGTETTSDVFGSNYFLFIPLAIVIFTFIFGLIYFLRQSKNFAENI
jgi:ABC-2 type transport system permease protein